MKKQILVVALGMAVAMSFSASAKETSAQFNAFVTSAELSYDAEVVNVEFSLYAINEGKFDCGDGDSYRITVNARDAWMYPIGKDFTLMLSDANDGVEGNESITEIIPQSTYVWDWTDSYVWSDVD